MRKASASSRAARVLPCALALLVGLSACSLIGGSKRISALPESCFGDAAPAVAEAVGPLAAQARKDEPSPEDAALSRPSNSTKSCARSFSDPVNRKDWKQGEPNFRRIFLEYDLYQGGFLSSGANDAKRELKPPLVDASRLVPEPGVGDEAVGWWDYSQSQGATWQISLRVSNMRVLVRVAGADYLSDYTVDRQFSAKLDYNSQRLQDELRREAQSIAKAVVLQLRRQQDAE